MNHNNARVFAKERYTKEQAYMDGVVDEDQREKIEERTYERKADHIQRADDPRNTEIM